MRVDLRAWEATAVGLFLGLVQVGLGFALLAGAATSVLLLFALPAVWLAAGALGSRFATERRATAGLALTLLVVPLARAALAFVPFDVRSVALGVTAGAVAGAFAGAYLAERALVFGDVARLLARENDGFVLGYGLGLVGLFVDARASDALALGLGALVLAGRSLARRGTPD